MRAGRTALRSSCGLSRSWFWMNSSSIRRKSLIRCCLSSRSRQFECGVTVGYRWAGGTTNSAALGDISCCRGSLGHRKLKTKCNAVQERIPDHHRRGWRRRHRAPSSAACRSWLGLAPRTFSSSSLTTRGEKGESTDLSTFVKRLLPSPSRAFATVWSCGSAACGRIELHCSRHKCMFETPGSPEPRLPRASEMSTS